MLLPIVRRRTKYLFFGAIAVILAAFGLFVFRSEIMAFDLADFKELIVSYGPWPFFLIMTVGLFVGLPVSPFLILSGIYGLEIAIAGCVFSVMINMVGGWALSGRWLRPFFERLVSRFGYSIPQFKRSDMIQVALLIRLTPGLPFFLQNYLLGLARMPLVWYLAVSMPIVLTVDVCVIIFGDALLRGDMGVIVGAAFLMIMISLIVRMIRNRLKEKRLESQLG